MKIIIKKSKISYKEVTYSEVKYLQTELANSVNTGVNSNGIYYTATLPYALSPCISIKGITDVSAKIINDTQYQYVVSFYANEDDTMPVYWIVGEVGNNTGRNSVVGISDETIQAAIDKGANYMRVLFGMNSDNDGYIQFLKED